MQVLFPAIHKNHRPPKQWFDFYLFTCKSNPFSQRFKAVSASGNYLNWFEEARVEYMREGGVCLNDLLAEGIVFPIVEMNVKYMKSAVYDDIVLVRAYLREVNRVKLVFEYEVLRENTNELLATGQSVGTYTKISTGKIVRIPEERLKKLMDMAEEDRTDG